MLVNTQAIELNGCYIDNNISNHSDHRALLSTITIPSNQHFIQKLRKPDKITKKKYQFNYMEFILELKSRIEEGVCTLDYQLKAMVTEKDKEKVKLKLTELTNQMVSILHYSAEKAMNVVKTKKKKKKQLKHKPWWDKTMRDLHIRTCLAYIKLRFQSNGEERMRRSQKRI